MQRTHTWRRACGYLLVIVGLVALVDAPIAGQATDASIVGQVTDESGAVLPGVTVTATSPSLQVRSIVNVTNELGEYRLAPMPIGVYTVMYELQGFQAVRREGVRLTAGFIAKVDVSLHVGALAETVTVSGASPVVDTTTTTTSTQFTRETLELIPGSRNGIHGIISQAPGVRATLDVGGDRINDHPRSRVFGQGGEHWYSIEGMPTSDMKLAGGAGNYWDYAVIDEAVVQTIGASAEAPTRGVQLNSVVKSGSNEFHGGGMSSFTNQSFQGENLDDALRSRIQAVNTAGGQGTLQTGNPLQIRYDNNVELGGRIIRNKLWFYGSLRARGQTQEVLGAFKTDGSAATNLDVTAHHTEKVSYQLNPSNKFIGFYQHTHKKSDGGSSQFIAWESRNVSFTRMPVGKVEWQGVKKSMVMSLLWGQWQSKATRDDIHPDLVSRTDLVTLMVSGEPQNRGSLSLNRRKALKGSLSWYKSDWFFGNHSFKAGFDAMAHVHSRSQGHKLHNYRLVYQNNIPFQMVAYNFPALPHAAANYTALFLQDSWTLGRRVTLNAGIRYSYDDGFVPAASREAADAPGHIFFPAVSYPKIQMAKWHAVGPRLHLAYDLTGNGKTAIKGGWGRFYRMRQLEPDVLRLDQNAINTVNYRWRDLNSNNDYDSGEVDLNPNGDDFVSTNVGALVKPDPNEQQPLNDEFSISIERELLTNLSLRLTTVYSRSADIIRLKNDLRPYDSYNIAVTNRDPGADGLANTADDPGTFITYYEFSRDLAGKAFEQYSTMNDPNADQNYKSFEVSAFKRLSNRWQLFTSFAATKSHIPFYAGLNQDDFTPQNVGPDYNPNSEINQTNNTWEWQGKVSGAYNLPAGVMASANLDHRSGGLYARQVQFRGGQTIPSIVLNAEPFGSRRLPNLNLLDLRVEKSFRLMQSQRVSVRANLYNALNGNTVLAVTPRAGEAFERPTEIMPPRIVEFGVTYTF